MKRLIFFYALVALYSGTLTASPSDFATQHAISATSIATLQQTITHNIFSAFAHPAPHTIHTQPATSSLPQIYGTMPTYGEYNDDGVIGRNGGDTRAPLSNIWVNWQYAFDDITPDNFDRFDLRHNLVTLGISAHQKKTTYGHYNWNFYGGYVNGSLDNNDINTDEHGGFIGLHNNLSTRNIIINSMINAGSIKNTTVYSSLSDDHINIWFGAAANIAYKFSVNDLFTIYPNISIGYTWVKNQTTKSVYGDDLQNQTFGFITATPALNIGTHISNNWFGTLFVKHTLLSNTADHITINDTDLTIPTLNNYTEYGLSIEKHLTSFDFKINFSRRDGGIEGWTGDINIKYMF